jgi:GntR family transcriptional regulator
VGPGFEEVHVPIETPRAKYRQLADLLRSAIETGEYPPGSLLPSEPELAQRYEVSRDVAHQAVVVLRGEGLVRVDRGRGTVVRELPVLRRNAVIRQATRDQGNARGAFQAELARLGLEARSDVTISELPAPADVANLLDISLGATVLVRRRLMWAGEVPVQIATSWLPAEIAAGTPLAELDTGPGGIYSRLADIGYGPSSFTESVRVRPAEDQEARWLRVDPEQRVLAIQRIARTAESRCVEVNDIVLAAHQWELVYEWSAGQQ